MPQYSVEICNAVEEAIEAAIGPAPALKIRTGAKPAHCTDPDAGSVVAIIQLADDWASDASGGTKAWSNMPVSDPSPIGGTAGHYRIYNAAGNCVSQGTISLTGLGGDLQLSSLVITPGVPFQISSWSWGTANWR